MNYICDYYVVVCLFSSNPFHHSSIIAVRYARPACPCMLLADRSPGQYYRWASNKMQTNPEIMNLPNTMASVMLFIPCPPFPLSLCSIFAAGWLF
jgi:hypothetical protein